MLILLPPSEGKTSPASGPAVDLAALSHPELADARTRVGNALVKVSGQRNALDALGVGASIADAVAANTRLWELPCAPAAQVYTGVLYDAAGMASWDAPTLARAHERLRIFSGLWGAVAPSDLIPAYRLSMGTTLGRLGGLGAFWRKHLAAPIDALDGGSLVVDCRSSSYVAAWKPPAETPWVTVKVMRDLDGKRAVVTHMAKHTRGLLAAHLLTYDAPPATAGDLADAAAGMIGEALVDVTTTASAKPGAPGELTLVIRG